MQCQRNVFVFAAILSCLERDRIEFDARSRFPIPVDEIVNFSLDRFGKLAGGKIVIN
jgi:hypothetical protein